MMLDIVPSGYIMETGIIAFDERKDGYGSDLYHGNDEKNRADYPL